MNNGTEKSTLGKSQGGQLHSWMKEDKGKICTPESLQCLTAHFCTSVISYLQD